MSAAAMEEANTPFAAALHDAKRGEFYFQMCSRDSALFAPRIGSLEDALNAMDAQTIALAGTGVEAFALHAKNKTIVTSIRQPDALWVARLALRVKPSDEQVRPLYLRAPDAKLPANV